MKFLRDFCYGMAVGGADEFNAPLMGGGDVWIWTRETGKSVRLPKCKVCGKPVFVFRVPGTDNGFYAGCPHDRDRHPMGPIEGSVAAAVTAYEAMKVPDDVAAEGGADGIKVCAERLKTARHIERDADLNWQRKRRKALGGGRKAREAFVNACEEKKHARDLRRAAERAYMQSLGYSDV